jgi:hypothetical protein
MQLLHLRAPGGAGGAPGRCESRFNIAMVVKYDREPITRRREVFGLPAGFRALLVTRGGVTASATLSTTDVCDAQVPRPIGRSGDGDCRWPAGVSAPYLLAVPVIARRRHCPANSRFAAVRHTMRKAAAVGRRKCEPR